MSIDVTNVDQSDPHHDRQKTTMMKPKPGIALAAREFIHVY
jgi:hypothetical protein